MVRARKQHFASDNITKAVNRHETPKSAPALHNPWRLWGNSSPHCLPLPLSASTFKFFETYSIVALLYLVMTLGLAMLVRFLEKRLE